MVPTIVETSHSAPKLLCPNCNGEYVHVNSVVVANEYDALRTLAKGEDETVALRVTTVRRLTGLDPGRRHTIMLEGYCEPGGCGQTFTISFQQAKGWTYVHTEVQS